MSSKADERKALEADVIEYLRFRALEVDGADAAKKNSRVSTAAARDILFLEQLSYVFERSFKEKPLVPKLHIPKSKGKTNRILNVMFSDTHYGAALDPKEVGKNYDFSEEARRTAAVVKQVVEYKYDHRDETELYVNLLGDMIQGALHDPRDGRPVAEQCGDALHLLKQAIRYLAIHFPRGVTVFCTPGNHGRRKDRHPDRAINQKWDSLETIIYLGLKAACEDLPNVKFQLDRSPSYTFNAFNNRGFATHGDTVLNAGYPGKSVNVGNITQQILKLNNAAILNGEKPYKLFIVGHVHVGAQVNLPGGVTLLTNSCLIPSDSYAISLPIPLSGCGQWIWESVPDHIVGDSRFVTVDENTDKDASLEKIVAPYKGFGF